MKNILNHQDTKTQSKRNLILLGVLVSWWFMTSSAQAAPFIYGPTSCDFTVTFPEKPFIEKKCADGTCVEVVTYTQMSEASSINFRTTCNPQDAKAVSLYEAEDLKKTLLSMVKEAKLETYDSDSAVLEDKTKTAVAMATGRRNDRDVLYIGQMWVGKKSVLTIEGEMQGPENKKLEEAYMGILKSLHSKNAPPATPKPDLKK